MKNFIFWAESDLKSMTKLSIFIFIIFCKYGSSIVIYYVCTEHHSEPFTFVD